MATGDAATAAGFPLVSDLDDLRDGAEEINLTRDLVANEAAARAAADALAFPAAKVILSPSSAAMPAVVNGAILLRYVP